MKDITPQALQEIIVDHLDYDGYGAPWGLIKDLHWEDDGKQTIPLEGYGLIEYIDSYGGEGQGDEYWVVFKVVDRYFQMNGWYSSWDGATWDGNLFEVKPVEVTVTRFEAI